MFPSQTHHGPKKKKKKIAAIDETRTVTTDATDYQPTRVQDDFYSSIAAMPIYSSLSPEELRWNDYQKKSRIAMNQQQLQIIQQQQRQRASASAGSQAINNNSHPCRTILRELHTVLSSWINCVLLSIGVAVILTWMGL